MTRPVLLVVVLALSLITTTAVAGVFLRFSAFSEPHPLRVLSSPLLTPSGSDVLGHLVVSVSGEQCVLEKIILIDKDGDSWEVEVNKVLPSGSTVPIKFVIEGAADDFPVGFDYTGILVSDAGTTYTVFVSTIVRTSWGSVPEWSQFMHDAQNTGYAGGYTPTSINIQIWKTKVATSSQNIIGGPILTKNGLIVITREYGPNGLQPRVNLINPETGEIKNSFAIEFAGDPTFGPVAANGLVYFVTENYVLAVDPINNQIIWNISRQEIGEEFMLKPDTSFYYFGFPAIYDKYLLLYTLYYNESYSKPYKPAVLCFDIYTGKIIWKTTLGNGYAGHYQGASFHGNSPVVANNTIWFVDWYGYVWGLNVNDGSIKMKLHTNKPIQSWNSPAYYKGYLYYIDINNNLIAVDTSLTRIVWTYPITDYSGYNVIASPVVVQDIIIAAAHYKIYAFDYKNGDLIWTYDVQNINAPIIIANGYLYAVCASYWVYIIEIQTGNVIYQHQHWEWAGNIAWFTCSLLYNGKVYYVDDSGYIHAITE